MEADGLHQCPAALLRPAPSGGQISPSSGPVHFEAASGVEPSSEVVEQRSNVEKLRVVADVVPARQERRPRHSCGSSGWQGTAGELVRTRCSASRARRDSGACIWGIRGASWELTWSNACPSRDPSPRGPRVTTKLQTDVEVRHPDQFFARRVRGWVDHFGVDTSLNGPLLRDQSSRSSGPTLV